MIPLKPGAPIALVDDDAVDRMIIVRVLKRCGVDNPVVEFPAATSFIDHLEQPSTNSAPEFSLVLMDINMPGMTGLEALGHIRSRPANATLPIVVMLSSSEADHDMATALELGADGYLVKQSGVANYVDTFTRTFAIGTRSP